MILDKTTGKIPQINKDNFGLELKSFEEKTDVSYVDNDKTKDFLVQYTITNHSYIVDKDTGEIKGNKDYTSPTPVVLSSIKSWTADANTDFHKESIRNTIAEIEFVDYIPNPVNLSDSSCWDVSKDKNQSIIAWLEDIENSEYKKLYIGGNGGVKANEDSSYVFYKFPNLESINFNNNYDTCNSTTMQGMFYGCKKIQELDLSSFSMASVENTESMFDSWNESGWGAMSLKTIYVSELWNMSNVTNSKYMFQSCSNLVGGNGTKSSAKASGEGISQDKKYAVIDKSGQKGYLTDKRQNMAENNKELEYIESTGTQYIDTGIIPKQNTEINIKFQVMNVNSSADCIIFGGEDGYNQNAFHLYRTNGNFDIGFSNQDFFGEYQSDTIYTLQLKDKSLTLNSTQSSALTGNINTPNSIYLFAVHRANIITETNCNKRIYYCKLYNEDTLIRDFIPVYNTITESYGLYDESNQKFYGNSGTGCFTGPEITKN